MIEITFPDGSMTLDDEAAEGYRRLPLTTYCRHGAPSMILGKPCICEKCEKEKEFKQK